MNEITITREDIEEALTRHVVARGVHAIMPGCAGNLWECLLDICNERQASESRPASELEWQVGDWLRVKKGCIHNFESHPRAGELVEIVVKRPRGFEVKRQGYRDTCPVGFSEWEPSSCYHIDNYEYIGELPEAESQDGPITREDLKRMIREELEKM